MAKALYTSLRPQYIKGGTNQARRILFLITVITILFVVIIGRLFQLQILKYKTYSAAAKEQHFGAITLNAKRGEIMVRDTHSGGLSKLATNTTLDLVYVDPFVIESNEKKAEIAKKLAPLLFTSDDYNKCKEKPDECEYKITEDTNQESLSTINIADTIWNIGGTKKNKTAEIKVKETFKDYSKITAEAEKDILGKISKTEIDFVVLTRDANMDLTADIINENLPGIFADAKHFMVYADPTLIPEGKLKETANKLANILGKPVKDIEQSLARRKVRYVFLKNRIDPKISRKIKELNLKGVVLLPEHWRYYPENLLASHTIGFLNKDGLGQYGVEGYFDTELKGKRGTIYAEKDPLGRQITVGKGEIVNAVDGDTIILTIDRIIQKKTEEVLKNAVTKYKADSGQVIIMDPFTGAITAMANYPAFDPNNYTDVYKLRALKKDELVEKTMPVFKLNDKGKYVPVAKNDLNNPSVRKYIYENKFGPSVFKNKIVSEFYEPGSVFKPIIMSMALDAKEVEPQTTFIDDGPLKIDEFTIKNSTGIYHGKSTMYDVLAYSLNTGMSFVAKKLGKKLMYEYLADFGIGEYTNVQLDGETKGRLDYYKQWSKAQLLTTSFGQGIIVTPLQLITAWAALANGGKLMQPYIVDSIVKEDKVLKNEPQVIKRVISEETSSIITAMNINTVRKKTADIPGYSVAGKTGTAQIAGKGGEYEKGEGTTITSFVGYAPALKPKFVMLIKLDRPRIGEGTWGETTAAPTFKEIGEFLMKYYNVQAGY